MTYVDWEFSVELKTNKSVVIYYSIFCCSLRRDRGGGEGVGERRRFVSRLG